MATRADVTRLLQEIRGYAEITNRRPLSVQGAPPVWMSIRPPVIQTPLPKRRLRVQHNLESQSEVPNVVKITFADSASSHDSAPLNR